MNLDEAQKARVREWIDQGLKVAEVQTRLAEELGVRLTYMEARFLLDDLALRPKDPAPAARPATPALPPGPVGPVGPSGGGLGGAPTAGGAKAGMGGLTPLEPAAAAELGGKVSLSVDQLARPGALVSGKVTFSDGQAAEWQMDQMGRLAVIPRKQGYKPSQADIADFQAELETALARMGF